MTRRRKSLIIVVVLIIIFLLLKVFEGNAQATQYQIDRVCIEGKCHVKRGFIAIDKENIYIRYDSTNLHLIAVKEFKYKQTTYYRLGHEYYTGTFQISPITSSAFLDFHLYGGEWVAEMYYLKK